MTMTMYHRSTETMLGDVEAAKEFEREVRAVLGPHVFDRSNSTDEVDFVIPAVAVEVKEKRQRLSQRWTCHLGDVPEREAFIIDELSYRRSFRHWPHCFFVLRDLPGERLFVAPLVELAVVPRTRLVRVNRAKLIFDLRHFRRLARLEDLMPLAMSYLDDTPWRKAGPVGLIEPVQV